MSIPCYSAAPAFEPATAEFREAGLLYLREINIGDGGGDGEKRGKDSTSNRLLAWLQVSQTSSA